MRLPNRGVAAIAMASALTGAALTAAAFYFHGTDSFFGTDPREPVGSERAHQIHEMGGSVMPFDLEATTHIFEMTDSGGIQDVVAKEPDDTATIRLIRQHLVHEADLFRRGDFRDPMTLHGGDMPGVQALSDGMDRLRVHYETLPEGARIVFGTEDPGLVTALHRWFGAQLSDHAADARYR